MTDTLHDRLKRELGELLEQHDAGAAQRDLAAYAEDPVGFARDEKNPANGSHWSLVLPGYGILWLSMAFFLYDPSRDRFIAISDGMLFGRTKGEEVFESDSLMSSRHFKIFFHDGKALLEDLNSTNGTRVNGKQVPAGKRAPLAPSDQVEFGNQKMVFTDRQEKPAPRLAGAAPKAKPDAPAKVEISKPAPAFKPAAAPRQVIEEGGLGWSWIALAVILAGAAAALHFAEIPFTDPAKLGSQGMFLAWSIGAKAVPLIAAVLLYVALARFVFPGGWIRGVAFAAGVVAFAGGIVLFGALTGFRHYKTVVPFAYKCAVLFDGRGCTLGLAQLNRAELETIPPKAAQWIIVRASTNLTEACGAKDPESCYGLGTFYLLSGDGTKALQARIAACSNNHAAACFEMGTWAMKNGNPKDGTALLQRACSLGVAQACPKP